MDALSDVLRVVQLTGAVYLDGAGSVTRDTGRASGATSGGTASG
jgi:hypothetical protein